MTQRSKLFSDHAKGYTKALESSPTLTLSVYCRKHLVSYTGLRKWMFKHGMKPTDLKRSIRESNGESGRFVMMQDVQRCDADSHDASDMLHDISIRFDGGISVSVGSSSASALSLLLQNIVRPCSH